MDESNWLAGRFEDNRAHLRAVAYRMLGSANEAEDAVQEAWLRLGRTDVAAVENLGGWLTTVVARVCLDMLRSRKSRREEVLGEQASEPAADQPEGDPEMDVLLADSVGPALLVVLETLAPAERVAFVLHDMFDLPFEEIAPIVGRSADATRQLASRARRRVQGTGNVPSTAVPDAGAARKREIVKAFLAASRNGDFDALLAMLDPDVVIHADSVATRAGAPAEMRGAQVAATNFKGRARAVRPALIDGAVGGAWAPGGQPRVVLLFTIEHDKIVELDVVMDPKRLGELEVVLLDD